MRMKTTIGAVIGLFATWLVLAADPSAQLPPLNSPASNERLPGKFIWFDLATPAIASQRSFYTSVFGWTFSSPVQTEDGYVLINNQGRPIAGMFSFEPASGEQDGAAWIALMAGADPDAAATAIKANGGTVEVEPMNIAGRGRHAVFRDPAGAVFGMLRSDSGDPPDAEVDIGGIIESPDDVQHFELAVDIEPVARLNLDGGNAVGGKKPQAAFGSIE